MSKERILNSAERKALKKALGEVVRKRRREIGLSQENLGFECGLHRTYIGAIERGETNLTIEGIAVLAIALRCDITNLVPSLKDIRKTSECSANNDER